MMFSVAIALYKLIRSKQALFVPIIFRLERVKMYTEVLKNKNLFLLTVFVVIVCVIKTLPPT